MSHTATRSSRSGKPSKTGERKSAHKTAGKSKTPSSAARSSRTVEKTMHTPKTSKTVRSKTKPKRETKVEKPKKAAKPVAAPKTRVRPKKARAEEPRLQQAKAVAESPVKPPAVRRGRPSTKKEPAQEMPREKRLAVSPLLPDVPKDEADAVEEYLEDDLSLEEDDLVIPGDIELDPAGLPLELLDPELVDVPRPTTPKPKPKITKSERRPQVCAGCGGTFTWLSVDNLCFSCLKRKLAQRKRDDESYTGFTPEPEEEDEG
jgi:hypothetical protein